MVLGTIFLGGHPYFLSVSNDFSEKKRDLKSDSQCPFKSGFLVVASQRDFREKGVFLLSGQGGLPSLNP